MFDLPALDSVPITLHSASQEKLGAVERLISLFDEILVIFRKDGPVFDTTNFRREWIKACVKLGLGKKTGEEWHQYEGLIPHDFRCSAARNLIRARVDQSIAMRITGHRTVAVFQHYTIVSTELLHEAMAKVSENATKTQIAVGGSRNNS